VTALYAAASLLTAIAIAILVLPLLRRRRVTGRWSTLGLGVSFAIVPVAFGLYQYVSNWDPKGQERADRGAALVNELEARLAQSPDNVQGWELLGHTYMMLGEHEKASRALREAWTRNPQDIELKLDYAEAQILSDRSALGGDAGRLVDEVLASEPDNLRALWYGGHVALEQGHDDDAKARWSKILQLDHPPEIETIVRDRLAALGETPPFAPATAGAPAGGPRTAAAATGPTIRLDLSLGAGRSIQQLPQTAALFVFARAPGGGPPLAVIRQPATAVPGQFTLSDANSMIPGRSLGDYDEITLIALLSKNGRPPEQPGDWKAEARFRPKDGGGTVALVIDQVVQ
jgi:cytochrome c-type biogenesis protein CcmH